MVKHGRKTHHVTPKDDKWQVKKGGAKRASAITNTQKKAIKRGRKLAKKDKSELVIHRPNGTIRDSDIYGNDPCPPKYRKYRSCYYIN